ncbi:hypothetical protein Tco_1258871, partial [Tanacetum coccineum]
MEVDTPYPMEGLESVQYGVSNGLDTMYWVFLGVGTTFDIFQNIHLLYLQYDVLVFSGYGVLFIFPLWYLIPLPPLLVPSLPLPLPLPPTTSPTYAEAPLGYRAAEIRLRAASPSTHHPSEIPLPPLLLPSTTHGDDLPEANMPLQKRAHFTTPTGRFEVGDSSSTAAARQAGQTLAHRVDYGFIDTIESSIRASESRVMTVVRVVNERVTNLATTQRQETHELQVHCEDTQYDQALLGAQVSILRRERRYFRSMASSYGREAIIARQQRIKDEDRLTAYIQHKHDRFRDLVCVAEAGPQDGPEDVGSC